MPSALPRLLVPGLAATLLLAAGHGSLHGQTVTRIDARPAFQLAAPGATNTVNFERNLGAAMGTGPLVAFTEAGFITFNNGPFSMQIADGFNLGQGGNDVYVGSVNDKTQITTDITFGAGVLALGLDLKNTSNGPTSPPTVQSFTLNLLNGATSLGTFPVVTNIDGSSFTFIGFTSDTPVTRLTIVATVPNASPNLDVVLDNFAVANPVPEPATTALLGVGGLLGACAVARNRRRSARRDGQAA